MAKQSITIRHVGLGKKLFEKHPDCYEITHICHQVFDTVAQNASEKKMLVGKMSPFQKILAKEFHRSWATFLAFLELCDDEFLLDAQTLCRKLLETQISLCYLETDPELLAKYYDSYSILRVYEDLVKARPYLTTRAEDIDNVLSQLELQMHELDFYPRNNGRIEKRFFRDWSGKTLRDMAEKTTLLDIYFPGSQILNYATHINSLRTDSFYDPETYTFGPPKNDGEFAVIVSFACGRMLAIARVVIKAFNFDLLGSCEHAERAVFEFDQSVARAL